MKLCVYTLMCMCMNVYLLLHYIYIHTYVHTHTHTQATIHAYILCILFVQASVACKDLAVHVMGTQGIQSRTTSISMASRPNIPKTVPSPIKEKRNSRMDDTCYFDVRISEMCVCSFFVVLSQLALLLGTVKSSSKPYPYTPQAGSSLSPSHHHHPSHLSLTTSTLQINDLLPHVSSPFQLSLIHPHWNTCHSSTITIQPHSHTLTIAPITIHPSLSHSHCCTLTTGCTRRSRWVSDVQENLESQHAGGYTEHHQGRR